MSSTEPEPTRLAEAALYTPAGHAIFALEVQRIVTEGDDANGLVYTPPSGTDDDEIRMLPTDLLAYPDLRRAVVVERVGAMERPRVEAIEDLAMSAARKRLLEAARVVLGGCDLLGGRRRVGSPDAATVAFVAALDSAPDAPRSLPCRELPAVIDELVRAAMATDGGELIARHEVVRIVYEADEARVVEHALGMTAQHPDVRSAVVAERLAGMECEQVGAIEVLAEVVARAHLATAARMVTVGRALLGVLEWPCPRTIAMLAAQDSVRVGEVAAA